MKHSILSSRTNVLSFRRVSTFFTLLPALLFWQFPVYAASLSLSPDALKIQFVSGKPRIHIQDFDMLGAPGTPELPAKIIRVPVSEKRLISGLTIDAVKWRIVAQNISLPPVQPPAILSLPAPSEQYSDPTIYGENAFYPSSVVEFSGELSVDHQNFITFIWHPLRWNPKTRVLQLAERVEYHPRYAVNRPEVLRAHREQDHHRSTASVSDPEYIIITTEALESVFEPLVDWKTRKGVPARIYTTEGIESAYSGRDTAERIRNFIKDAYATWHTEYVLLGGDTDVVPDRIAFAMDCEAGYYDEENELSADLYYSDLDGDWDANGNDIFGEVDDAVDLVPEVYVGRVPAGDAQEASAVVNKIIQYERTPATENIFDMLFCAEVLWTDPMTDSGIFKDMIDTESVPASFDPIEKLYETSGNETVDSVIASMNAGPHFVNHAGHAFYSVMGMGNGYMTREQASALINSDSPFILYSIGCWAGAIDHNCIGEMFLTNSTGGAVAFIGNSRYGWGSPGNPGWGYSSQIDRKFFHFLFQGNRPEIGRILAETKQYYIPVSREENVWRWHQYQLNLLGDPEMPVWTDYPRSLSMDFPGTIAPGLVSLPITVYSQDDDPVENARVCLWKPDELYWVGYTDSAGHVQSSGAVLSHGLLHVTAWAQNCIPVSQDIIVSESSAGITVSDVVIEDDASSDTSGNNDHRIEPGETVRLYFQLRNVGTDTVSDIDFTATSEADDIHFSDNTSEISIIAPGESVLSDDPMLMTVDNDAAANTARTITISINYSVGAVRESVITDYPVRICGADLKIASFIVYDTIPGGDADAVAEAGEDFSLQIMLKNAGEGSAERPQAVLSTMDPYLSISQAQVLFPDLEPGQTLSGESMFTLHLGELLPPGRFPMLQLSVTTQTKPDQFALSFPLPAGDTGFSDAIETGENEWQHGGSVNAWHISSHRSHSADHSWYVGSETTYMYAPDMSAWLETPRFYLAPDSELQLYRWFDFPMYGSDGCFVEIFHSGEWISLDYIGSGGALLNLDSDWTRMQYDLSDYSGEVKIRFRFVSDAEDNGTEGIYLDDITVTGYTGSAWNTEPPTPTPQGTCIHDGDVDGNGIVSSEDAQRAFLIALGMEKRRTSENCSADCNADGTVTAGDAQRIFQLALGIGACVDK